MEAKFSNRVKEVISLSREEALRLGHDYIGTEHLLLGVIREGEGVAIGLLKKLGISLEDLRASVEHNTKNTTSSNLSSSTTTNPLEVPSGIATNINGLVSPILVLASDCSLAF